MAEKFLIPIYMPSWMHEPLVRVKRVFIPPTPVVPPPPKNLVTIDGERHVEWSFLSRELPDGPGEALEFGCELGYMSLLAAQKGYRVLATDLESQPFTWWHPLVEFREGDFLKMDLPSNYYNLAINCSSVEHVGIVGRYGISEEENDGDIQVMQRLADILKPGGLLLMTAPCGQDVVMAPWNRVYGYERLPRVLAPFQIVKQAYWVKDAANRWTPSDRDMALNFQPRYDPSSPYECLYALGCFVLQKSAGVSTMASSNGQ